MPSLLAAPPSTLESAEDSEFDLSDLDFEESGGGSPGCEVEFGRPQIAELSASEIQHMPIGELADAIRAADVLHFFELDRLDYMNREILERLLFLARRCCRNRGY